MADAKVKALYNAARRYCIDRFETCHVLHRVLEEIERAVPEDFSTEEEARRYLIDAGKKGKVISLTASWGHGEVVVHYQEPEIDVAERAAMEIERAEYLSFISTLSCEQAAEARPVLFRHLMSDTKRRRVANKLLESWKVDPLWHYWYPLWEELLPYDVIAFQDAYFYKEVGAEKLQDIFLRRGITRIWEINEDRLPPEYELDPRLCNFTSSVEKYWSSRELDWLVYASHESSITFAGDWLIGAIKEAWPNWEQRVYTGYDYERPKEA